MATGPVRSPNNDDFIQQHLSGLETVVDMRGAYQENPSEITLDFTSVEWIEAPAIVPLSCAINELEARGCQIRIKEPESDSARSYLDSIRFPDGVGSTRWLLGTYLPLFQLNPDDRTDELEGVGEKVRDLVGRSQDSKSNEVTHSIVLPLSETLANVDQHSEFRHATVMAQFYPTKEYVDISIADNGITIPGCYENHDVDFQDDSHAIRRAVIEGISTRDSPPSPTGAGLRTIRGLVCDGLGGDLLVSTRNCVTHFSSEGNRDYTEYGWAGTVISARIFPPDPGFSYLDYVS